MFSYIVDGSSFAPDFARSPFFVLGIATVFSTSGRNLVIAFSAASFFNICFFDRSCLIF